MAVYLGGGGGAELDLECQGDRVDIMFSLPYLILTLLLITGLSNIIHHDCDVFLLGVNNSDKCWFSNQFKESDWVKMNYGTNI